MSQNIRNYQNKQYIQIHGLRALPPSIKAYLKSLFVKIFSIKQKTMKYVQLLRRKSSCLFKKTALSF